MIPKHLRTQCRTLRRKGCSLPKIVRITNLPKTTSYDQIKDIQLPDGIKAQFIEASTKRIVKFNKQRKGKSNKSFTRPKGWSSGLISLVSHFMFDGEINGRSCIYSNRNLSLIHKMKDGLKRVFGITDLKTILKEDGVTRISYHNVEFSAYIEKKAKELLKYIRTVSLGKKRIFLRSFFDDEGSVYFCGRKRLVRGFQHSLMILNLIRNLLADFNIESKIDKKYQEIVISRKENLIKFRDKINFSKGVYINPNRKNSIWKKRLSKREILDKAIGSYLS